MTEYNKYSPYYKTEIVNGYLDIMSPRNILPEVDDILFEVTKVYEHRPDLLAYDLYSDVNLWWVFAARNRNVLEDPVFDLEAGIKVYLPKITTINKALGL